MIHLQDIVVDLLKKKWEDYTIVVVFSFRCCHMLVYDLTRRDRH